MSRLSFSVLWVGVVLVASFVLYRVKYEVQSIKAQISELSQEVMQEKEALHVAAAEWAYLNRPERLKAITAKYLDGKDITVEQIAEVEAIEFHEQTVAVLDVNKAARGVVPVSLYYYENDSAGW